MKHAAARSKRVRRRGKIRTAPRLRRRFVGKRTGKPEPRKASPYDEGYEEGYREGMQRGVQSFSTPFPGTSIIIPTYNQIDFLKQCVASIMEHTVPPYEIIVVDNASTDGTEAYLKSLGGQVRHRILDSNKGFSGAINVGMMMAKGDTLLLLNNDTLATERWLDNMLECLNSDERIGIVGPVTNYIGGDQQINVPYKDVKDMPAFAREFNKPDPGRWRRTDRLVGFCLLFKRSLFEQIGYFDEGFEIGNFEDDDYNIRVRMLGRSLVVAGDAFIHHYGSVSMKALGDQAKPINDKNEHYFRAKWENPYESVHQVLQLIAENDDPVQDAGKLYPSGILVKGLNSTPYWVEDGVRRPVEGELTLPVTRVSQVDLRRWPIASPISAGEAEQRYVGLANETSSALAKLPDETFYVLEGAVARKVVSRAAMEAWKLNRRPIRAMTPEELALHKEGLPIIAPPQLRQAL
ncbi:glycosyltransferase family 2 protein [Cohnella thailandensis]|uniref:Glycosyltransferase family 2 protein n=1 Tax=Cohnella thailandensis TaxID=557557 RepID=A0A841SV99_9BACL|nr:glycosyltransferase family 2 protein [Cohnella thailandensis]MBB6635844.1 glycosyltransferase family 2 protein [Cohnella thailandensis]MBP1976222.1 GT2 family glycosyltransferase [Cohnella thailandensis]